MEQNQIALKYKARPTAATPTDIILSRHYPMVTLQVENLPDELYRSIQSLATARSVTLNDAVIQLLTQAIQPDVTDTQQAQVLKESSAALARIRSRPRVNPLDFGLPDSTQMIREDRNR